MPRALTTGLGKVGKTGVLNLGLPYLSGFGLAWLPAHRPLGELSSEAGASEEKINGEEWQG